MASKSLEITQEMNSYLSRVRRVTLGDTVRDFFKKRKKKVKPKLEEAVPVEAIKADIEQHPIQKGEITEETETAVVGNDSLIKLWYGKFLKLFKAEQEDEMPTEPEANEIKETELSDAEFEKELSVLEAEEKAAESTGGILKFISSLNFFKRFKQLPGYNVPDENDLDKVQEGKVTRLVLERPEVEKDMKRIALVTQSILHRLPDEKIQEFKDSDDFLIYKDVLKKYDLIKEQEEIS